MTPCYYIAQWLEPLICIPGLITPIIILKTGVCQFCRLYSGPYCFQKATHNHKPLSTPSLKSISGAFPYLNYLKELALSLGSVIEARQWLPPYGWKTRHIFDPSISNPWYRDQWSGMLDLMGSLTGRN